MPKVTENTFSIMGKSGKTYSFLIYTLDTEFKNVGGIYVFTNRHLSNEKYTHEVIYIGKSGNISERLPNHHKAECIKRHNANCICIMQVDTESERTLIEEDLLKGNDTKCNDLLVST